MIAAVEKTGRNGVSANHSEIVNGPTRTSASWRSVALSALYEKSEVFRAAERRDGNVGGALHAGQPPHFVNHTIEERHSGRCVLNISQREGWSEGEQLLRLEPELRSAEFANVEAKTGSDEQTTRRRSDRRRALPSTVWLLHPRPAAC